eukprot:scaffold665134_cov74-Prasinocladus_malaysianus.AAC.3
MASEPRYGGTLILLRIYLACRNAHNRTILRSNSFFESFVYFVKLWSHTKLIDRAVASNNHAVGGRHANTTHAYASTCCLYWRAGRPQGTITLLFLKPVDSKAITCKSACAKELERFIPTLTVWRGNASPWLHLAASNYSTDYYFGAAFAAERPIDAVKAMFVSLLSTHIYRRTKRTIVRPIERRLPGGNQPASQPDLQK